MPKIPIDAKESAPEVKTVPKEMGQKLSEPSKDRENVSVSASVSTETKTATKQAPASPKITFKGLNPIRGHELETDQLMTEKHQLPSLTNVIGPVRSVSSQEKLKPNPIEKPSKKVTVERSQSRIDHVKKGKSENRGYIETPQPITREESLRMESRHHIHINAEEPQKLKQQPREPKERVPSVHDRTLKIDTVSTRKIPLMEPIDLLESLGLNKPSVKVVYLQQKLSEEDSKEYVIPSINLLRKLVAQRN